jgi:hypothetical protein
MSRVFQSVKTWTTLVHFAAVKVLIQCASGVFPPGGWNKALSSHII